MMSFFKKDVKTRDSLAQYAFALVGLWVSLILVAFVKYPPYWSLMDDEYHLQEALGGFHGFNFIQYLQYGLKADVGWGMFRPVYWAYVYLFYGTFKFSSEIAYIALLFLNCAMFWLWALVFEKSIRITLGKTYEEQSFKVFKFIFILFCLLFSPNYTLFFFASLQERLVLIFSGLVFLLLLKFSSSKSIGLWDSLMLFLVFSLTLLSKACAIFIIPIVIVWLLVIYIEQRDNLILLTFGGILFVSLWIGFHFLNIRTGYTSDYQLQSMWLNWRSMGGRVNAGVVQGIVTIGLIWFYYKKRLPRINKEQIISGLFWPLGLIAFLLVMLPWKSVVNYYLILPGGMFWTGCKAISCVLIYCLIRNQMRKVFISALLLLCACVSIPSAIKFWKMTYRHYSTRHVVEFLTNEFKSSQSSDVDIRMPDACVEASQALGIYVGQVGAVKTLGPDLSLFLKSSKRRKMVVLAPECNELPAGLAKGRVIFNLSPWSVLEYS